MSTRTTLNERIIKRTQQGKKFIGTKMHIRAELNRLARQVRKLPIHDVRYCSAPACKACNSGSQRILLSDVLELIKEAKR